LGRHRGVFKSRTVGRPGPGEHGVRIAKVWSILARRARRRSMRTEDGRRLQVDGWRRELDSGGRRSGRFTVYSLPPFLRRPAPLWPAGGPRRVSDGRRWRLVGGMNAGLGEVWVKSLLVEPTACPTLYAATGTGVSSYLPLSPGQGISRDAAEAPARAERSLLDPPARLLPAGSPEGRRSLSPRSIAEDGSCAPCARRARKLASVRQTGSQRGSEWPSPCHTGRTGAGQSELQPRGVPVGRYRGYPDPRESRMPLEGRPKLNNRYRVEACWPKAAWAPSTAPQTLPSAPSSPSRRTARRPPPAAASSSAKPDPPSIAPSQPAPGHDYFVVAGRASTW